MDQRLFYDVRCLSKKPIDFYAISSWRFTCFCKEIVICIGRYLEIEVDSANNIVLMVEEV